ncbi:MAG: nitrogenase iron-molybdenum cofactor biosynthesis protein NifE [Thermodesulfovibrionales bacterium]|nr:nitrogenase iron-molybdenum cofactor biosynthesis protein NifE [Thermodesulfovibrionales bacterium]
MFSTEKVYKEGCLPETKQGVCRSRGGESCAFDGAMIVLQPLADCAHIVHGPIACCANSWEGRGTLSTHGDLYKHGFTTSMTELDIIYGSEGKLYDAIIHTVKKVNPEAVFVYATCVSGLIGEDIEAVCKRAETETGKRIIPVNAPGFVGPKNLGNRLAGETLLEYVIGTAEFDGEFEPNTAVINLIGEYNIAGDLYDVEPVLKEAGINILSRMTGNGTFKEITYAHRAHLNVVVCSRALINVAKVMQRRYGIPYVEASFFGMTEMARTMRLIAQEIKTTRPDIDITERVESVINRYEAITRDRLNAFTTLKGKRAILYGGGVKSWSYINALRDLGIEPVAVAVKKSTYEDEQKVKELLGDKALIFEDTTAKNIKRIYKEYDAHMLIAGSRNLYIAVKEGYPYVDINQERHISYAGYNGLVNLAEQIDAGLRFYGVSNQVRPHTVTLKHKENTKIEIDPLRHSQSMGAIMAIQGIDRAMPILHGGQGCSFLSKVLLIKHFREPIALSVSRLFTEDVVMGSEEKLQKVIEDTISKQNPDLIAVLSTALSDVKGDDISRVIKDVKGLPNSSGTTILSVSTPDYEGGLQDGYMKVLKALLVETMPKYPISQKDKISGQINIIAGSHLTPADFVEIREIVEAFRLKPIFIPDLGCLDGSRKGFSALTSGGTTMADIKNACASEFSIVIGSSLGNSSDSPARMIEDLCAIGFVTFEGLQSLSEIDRFFDTLRMISGRDIPQRYQRQRARLIDGMRDAHFYLSSKRAIIALESDHAIQISRLLEDMSMQTVLTVVPLLKDDADKIVTRTIMQGDLNDIDERADVIISNSHAEQRARLLDIPLYQIGFPSYKLIGMTHRETIGYRGMLNCINDLVNLIHGGH